MIHRRADCTMSASIMMRSAAKATASVQVALTAFSLIHGTYANTLPPDNEEGWMLDRHAKMYAWLPQLDLLVVEAYMGHGISPRYMCLPPTSGTCSSTGTSNNGANNDEDSRTFIQLGDDATFEDSAVMCSGPEEIAEAFRALHVARPEFIRHPHRIDLEDVKESRDGTESNSAVVRVTYYMHQRYAGILTVKSLLRVTVDKCDSRKASIVKIVEEWNGVEPLEYPPFFLSRRINGILSWWLTTLFVR